MLGTRSACSTGVVLALALIPAGAQGATVTVSDGGDGVSDNAVCVLREAVIEANTDGTDPIDDCAFTGGFGAETINLTATVTLTVTGDDDTAAMGDLDVTDDLTITGSGAPAINQSEAGNDQRVLEVPAVGDDLSLTGLTVTGGQLDDSATNRQGANIRFVGAPGDDLALTDVDVTNGFNSSTLDVTTAGGNIHASGLVTGGGTVTIQGGSSVSGGVSDSDQPDNTNPNNGGGIAIEQPGNTSLTITDSTVSGNTAGSSSSGGLSRGGGIFFDPGVFPTPAQLTLTDATVTMNQSLGGNTVSGSGTGGGIEIGGAPVDVTITGGEVSDNDAGGGVINAPGRGGGIRSVGNGVEILFDGTEITGNEAGARGGTAGGDGGGIDSNGTLEIHDSTISMNKAGDATSNGSSGGGIRASVYTAAQSFTMTGTTLSDNLARSPGGGAHITFDGEVTIADSTISGNTSIAGGGGGIYRETMASPDTPTDSITRTTISDNTAGLPIMSAFAFGGGLSWQTKGTLTISRSTISGNLARADSLFQVGSGGGAELSSSSEGPGTYTIENSTISGNTSEGNAGVGATGGGISFGARIPGTPPSANIINSTIASNTAEAEGTGGQGGSLWANGAMAAGNIDLDGSIVSGGTGVAMSENCSSTNTGVFDSLGGNVEGPTSAGGAATNQCELDQPSDVHADPLLAPLAPNGGPTETRALMGGSPAFNLVPAALCPPPSLDQIGTPRPQGPACDAGAFEVIVPTVPIVLAPPVTQTPATATTPRKKCRKKKRRHAAAAKRCKRKRK